MNFQQESAVLSGKYHYIKAEIEVLHKCLKPMLRDSFNKITNVQIISLSL